MGRAFWILDAGGVPPRKTANKRMLPHWLAMKSYMARRNGSQVHLNCKEGSAPIQKILQKSRG